ncbi:hypothetical protein GLOIN_2v1787594 [Rhizophagus clarus]|uniref:Tyr recombinase domain-containing protein n=1 Tax=Rhizophagus clarus TaxID=94130 RepID=A0A8H3LF99_9GLOM|nr:hypothetical protein GLOIN_2v1787594 [Rhizophagus clarus]
METKKLLKVQESCVPQSTVKCIKKWVNILNSWRNHEYVGYTYKLKSLSSNQQIEKEMWIDAAKPHESLTNEELKLILDHDAMSPNNPEGLLRRVFLWVFIRIFMGGMFREICIACGIDISGRNISNHSERDKVIQSIFDAGNKEIEAMAISGHNLSTGVHNYLKVTKEKKRKILG